MHPRLKGRAHLAAAVLLVSGGVASADPNDFRIHQLGNPANTPDANASFRTFARELAAGLTSVNLMPPETLGHAAWSVTGELSLLSFSKDIPWPTESARGGSAFGGGLLVPSVHVRKGLPFSTEIGLRTAWIDRSRMLAATAEGKVALNEGFAYLPDLGVRGHVTRLFNARDFDLTTFGVDVGLGKQFAVGGMVTLTPYAGWDLNWVSALSGQVDFQPERTHEESIRSTTAQLTNVNVYDELSFWTNSHNRFYVGLRFIGGVVQLGAEFSYASMGRFHDAQTDSDRSMPAVMAGNFTAGLDF